MRQSWLRAAGRPVRRARGGPLALLALLALAGPALAGGKRCKGTKTFYAGACRYPEEIERLQPYIGVGPALLFASQRPAVAKDYNLTGTGRVDVLKNGQFAFATSFNPNNMPYSASTNFHSDSDVALALAVDAGFRWMALKNVSIDVFFNYRYAQPSFKYSSRDKAGVTSSFDWKPTFHLFGGGVGAAYHF